jgi:hypothetical protein
MADARVSEIVPVWLEAGRPGDVGQILIAAAMLAAFVASWRAARIDPMTALRHE